MKLFSKRLLVNKTYEEVCKIICSLAYKGHCEFADDTFFIQCAKRNERGQVFLVPVKGAIGSVEDRTEINIELHAGVGVYIGTAFIVAGLTKILIYGIWSFIDPEVIWYEGALDMLFGVVIAGFFALRSVEIMDLLIHKLEC